jgi:hypothetical protein
MVADHTNAGWSGPLGTDPVVEMDDAGNPIYPDDVSDGENPTEPAASSRDGAGVQEEAGEAADAGDTAAKSCSDDCYCMKIQAGTVTPIPVLLPSGDSCGPCDMNLVATPIGSLSPPSKSSESELGGSPFSSGIWTPVPKKPKPGGAGIAGGALDTPFPRGSEPGSAIGGGLGGLGGHTGSGKMPGGASRRAGRGSYSGPARGRGAGFPVAGAAGVVQTVMHEPVPDAMFQADAGLNGLPGGGGRARPVLGGGIGIGGGAGGGVARAGLGGGIAPGQGRGVAMGGEPFLS